VLAFGVVPLVEFDRSVLFDGAVEIDGRAVYRCGQGVGS
jgi:hypothetical protein